MDTAQASEARPSSPTAQLSASPVRSASSSGEVRAAGVAPPLAASVDRGLGGEPNRRTPDDHKPELGTLRESSVPLAESDPVHAPVYSPVCALVAVPKTLKCAPGGSMRLSSPRRVDAEYRAAPLYSPPDEEGSYLNPRRTAERLPLRLS